MISNVVSLFSDRPPVFAARAPQPPPVPQPPQMQQYGYGMSTQQPPYPPTAGGTPYPPVPPTNNPYPPPGPGGGGPAYPPYPTSNMNSATPYPPAYPPAASSGYPPYPQGGNQPVRNEDSNSGTITSEHLKVKITFEYFRQHP